MGVPIIATDVGGIPDILELGAGLLVSPEISGDDLAQHLARLIDNPDQMAELSKAPGAGDTVRAGGARFRT